MHGREGPEGSGAGGQGGRGAGGLVANLAGTNRLVVPKAVLCLPGLASSGWQKSAVFPGSLDRLHMNPSGATSLRLCSISVDMLRLACN